MVERFVTRRLRDGQFERPIKCDIYVPLSGSPHCAHQYIVGVWPFGERINGILQLTVGQTSSVRTCEIQEVQR